MFIGKKQNYVLDMIFKYYSDVTKFNLGFSLVVALFSPFGAMVTFGTFGNLIGIFCYNYFYRNQYYFYFNHGLSKQRLVSFLFKVNLPIAIPIAWLLYPEL